MENLALFEKCVFVKIICELKGKAYAVIPNKYVKSETRIEDQKFKT